MKDSWTDFEKYVFEKLEGNSAEHAEIKTEIALLKAKPRKVINWKIGLGGIGAVIAAIIAAIKGTS